MSSRYVVAGFYFGFDSAVLLCECETMDEVAYEADYLTSEGYRIAILDREDLSTKVFMS